MSAYQRSDAAPVKSVIVMKTSDNPKRAELIAIASMLMATIALSVDVMLPALGDMAREFGASDENQRQLVIISLLVGLTVGQLIFGPLSDRIGRRPAITIGATIFTIGGLVCATASTFEILISGRILQGVGAAGPRIVTVALIRDRFRGAEMAHVISIIMGIFIMVPVLAPSIGQGLLFFMPWRGLFGVLSAICVVGTSWLLLRQPETLVEERGLNARTLGIGIWEVLNDSRAMAFTLAGGLCYGGLMGYINASQQLFQDLYGVGNLYALLFGGSASFISAATLTNARLVKRFAMGKICIIAVGSLIVWSLGALGFMLIQDRLPSLWQFMAFNCPALFLLGLTFGNFNAIALERLGHIAGLATATTASIQTLVGIVVAGIIGLNFNMSLYPTFLGYAASGAAALALMSLPVARSEVKPTPNA